MPLTLKQYGTIALYTGVFLAALLFFSLGLGAASRSKGAERYFLLAGFTMAQTGDWLTPVYEEKLRFQKPPLAYWMIAASYKLFGVHLWAARLPSAVAGALGVTLTALFGHWLFCSRKVGLLAALFLATCLGYLIQSRTAVTDIYLLLFTLAAIMLYAWELFSASSSEARRIGMWAALGMAFLAKGHLGVIIPFLLAAAVGVQRGFSLKKALRPWASPLGWMVFLLIVAPWFMVMRWVHGSAFFDHLLVSETKRRVGISLLNIGWNAVLYTKNWFLYFFPVSWFLIMALLDRLGATAQMDREKQNLFRFLWTWIAVVLFLFVVMVYDFQSGYYLVPLTPAMALLAGAYAVEKEGAARRWRLWRGFFILILGVMGILFIAAAVATLFTGWWGVRIFLVSLALMGIPAAGGLALHGYVKSCAPNPPEIWKPLAVVAAAFGVSFVLIMGLWEPLIKEPGIVRMAQSAAQRPMPQDRLYTVGINEADRSWLVIFSQHTINRSFFGPTAVEEASRALQEEKGVRLSAHAEGRASGRLFLALHPEDVARLDGTLRDDFTIVGEGCQLDAGKIRKELSFLGLLTGKLRPGQPSLQRCVVLLADSSVSP